MKSEQSFYSGTSGLVLPIPRAMYPPAYQGKSRLTYYASLFNSVEINSSFYKPPQSSTVIKWAESVPDNFRFTFKLYKAITHAKELDFNAEEIDLFMRITDHVGDKKGCLLVQFPPKLNIDKLRQVEMLLTTIKKANQKNAWRIAIEFRNATWYQQEVYDLLQHYNTALVLHDLPATSPSLSVSTADFQYLRFHGPGGKYRGSYTDEFLTEFARNIDAWMDEGKMVYFYFNNTMGDAVKNLQTLNSFLKLPNGNDAL